MRFLYAPLAEKLSRDSENHNGDIEEDESTDYESRSEALRQQRTQWLHWIAHTGTVLVIVMLIFEIYWRDRAIGKAGLCQAHIPCK